MPTLRTPAGTGLTLKEAKGQFDFAMKELGEAVCREYPVGAIVEIKLGRSHVRGVVVSHGQSWSLHSFTDVVINNERTGKNRTFNASGSDDARVVGQATESQLAAAMEAYKRG